MTTAHIQGYLNIAVEFVKAIAWPVFGIVIVRQFKGAIVNALDRSKAITLKFAGAEIKVSGEEAAGVLSGILDKILTELLTRDEKRLLLRVLAYPAPPRVDIIFPDFVRVEKHEKSRDEDIAILKMLRALRGVAFIQPQEGGQWEPWKHIEVTDSGRLVGRYRNDVLQGSNVVDADRSAIQH